MAFTTIQVRGEDGDVRESVGDHGELARLVASLPAPETIACLRFVDPYGNTIFNAMQAAELGRELDRLADRPELEAEPTLRLREMAGRVADGTHEYLWLIGD